MTTLQTFLASQMDRRLREREQLHKQRVRGLGAEAGYEMGVRSALATLEEIFSAVEVQADLREMLAIEASKLFNTGPHPRSRVYRSEPSGWQIEDTDAAEVLAALRTRLAKVSRPAIVFDLDGTLFDVSHRTLGILKEWLLLPESRRHPRALVRRVESIALCHMGYSLSHAFENAGLDLRNEDVADMLHSAEKHWRRKFFDGKTLVDFDIPVAGAKEFVGTLQAEGVHICYLTGRDHRGMHQGTVRQLEKHGFPLEGVTVLLKQNHEEEDHAFKQAAFSALTERWDVIGNFENEYINISQMAPAAPEACHVVLDTQHSGRPVPDINARVYRLESFQTLGVN